MSGVEDPNARNTAASELKSGFYWPDAQNQKTRNKQITSQGKLEVSLQSREGNSTALCWSDVGRATPPSLCAAHEKRDHLTGFTRTTWQRARERHGPYNHCRWLPETHHSRSNGSGPGSGRKPGVDTVDQGSQTQLTWGPLKVDSGWSWAASSIPQKKGFKYSKKTWQLIQSSQSLIISQNVQNINGSSEHRLQV